MAMTGGAPEAAARRSGFGARLRNPHLTFVMRRLGQGILTLLAASILIFIGTELLPGSPASAVLGKAATPKVVAEMNHKIGYDRPVLDRYWHWLTGILHGSLGNSAVAAAQGLQQAPIWPIIRSPLLDSTILAGIVVLILIPLSLLLGLTAGVKAGRLADNLISTVTLVFMAMPEFVVAALLIAVFFVWLDVLPPVSLLAPGQSPFDTPKILILPVLTLLSVSIAWSIRMIRAGTIEVLKTDYVQMARLHGLSERVVLRKYVLRNALAPSIQIFALSIQYLFGGVIVTEIVFNYPGIGTQLVNSVSSHDNTEVQAIAMILAALYILINIGADLLVVLLVPKLRSQA